MQLLKHLKFTSLLLGSLVLSGCVQTPDTFRDISTAQQVPARAVSIVSYTYPHYTNRAYYFYNNRYYYGGYYDRGLYYYGDSIFRDGRYYQHGYRYQKGRYYQANRARTRGYTAHPRRQHVASSQERKADFVHRRSRAR